MKVDVKLYATLKTYAPKDLEIGESFPLELEHGTIREALEKIGIPMEKAKIIMINGIRVPGVDVTLKNGDLLVIFPPIGGG